MAKKRFGIDALFQTSVPAAIPTDESGRGEYREIDLASLRPNPSQPRRHFDPESLEQLAASIRTHGLLQPLLVRPVEGEEAFEIVAGERRWRAARTAGLGKVPVRIVEFDDRQARAAAMTENLQREDLDPIEEADGYLDLICARLESDPLFAPFRDEAMPRSGAIRLLRALNNAAAGNSKDNVVLSLEPLVAGVFAEVGRMGWASFVAHRLPLLNLPEDVISAVRGGKLPYTKARHIARLTPERLGVDPEAAARTRGELIERTVREGLSVRELQTLTAAGVKGPKKGARRRRAGLEGRIDDLISRLETLELDQFGPARRAEVASAVETLLRLI